MSNEPKGTDQPASTRHHQGNGKLRHIRSEIRTRLRRLLDGDLRRRLRALAHTAGHGIVRGSAGAVGASGTAWIIWWIQQR
ncbi:Hpt domain-containing protein [Streptomyces blattellae]|uniref:Hpt domain-containing protein n=1 Tax=Streptomyces blattellae TaxID=2569855 RepID=UPI0012B6DFDA|nr:Hpt domain-containing protein [Streptomyces blattellae]